MKNGILLFFFLSIFGLSLLQGQGINFKNIDKAELNFGASLNMNYSMLGARHDNYAGRGLGGFGMFISRPISRYHTSRFLNMWDMMLEPAFNIVSTREQQTDVRYTGYYLDGNFNFYFIPDRSSNDLQLFMGLRPSYLMYNTSEVFEFGDYKIVADYPKNYSRKGDLDLSGVLGLSVALGEVVTVEIKYCHSFSDRNTDNVINGRASTLEFGLRLSALSVRDKVAYTENSTRKQIQRLAKGTLLVMLPTPNNNEIRALEARGLQREVPELVAQNTLTNRMVMNTFRSEFSFCRVLYFMDTSAYKVVNHQFAGVFVDENFNPLPDVEIDTNNFFVASFCNDASTYTLKYDYGLYVYNGQMEQLGRPFNVPSNFMSIFSEGDPLTYIRKRRQLFESNSYTRVVRKFNNRMQRYRLID